MHSTRRYIPPFTPLSSFCSLHLPNSFQSASSPTPRLNIAGLAYASCSACHQHVTGAQNTMPSSCLLPTTRVKCADRQSVNAPAGPQTYGRLEFRSKWEAACLRLSLLSCTTFRVEHQHAELGQMSRVHPCSPRVSAGERCLSRHVWNMRPYTAPMSRSTRASLHPRPY